MLVAGSVIIGTREEGKEVSPAGTTGPDPALAAASYSDEPDAPPPSVGRPPVRTDSDGAYDDGSDIELETTIGKRPDGVESR
jgi:hypothetical protein